MNTEEHARWREMLGAFALGQLDRLEQSAVQAHLDGCADCRAELASIAPLAGPLRLADPDRLDAVPASPPPWLEQSILAAIDGGPHPRRRLGRSLLAAAAAVAIGLAGATVGYSAAPKPPKIPLEPVPVTVVAAGIHSTADVVAHSWGMEIKLTATGFAMGRHYRVFVVRQNGRLTPAGEFIGVGPREMHCNLNSSVLRTDALQFRILDDQNKIVATAIV